MISSLVLNILNFFDYFHKKKIKNFFKNNNFLNFNCVNLHQHYSIGRTN